MPDMKRGSMHKFQFLKVASPPMPWALEDTLRPHPHCWPQLPGRGRGCSYWPSWYHHLILTPEIGCKRGSRLMVKILELLLGWEAVSQE